MKRLALLGLAFLLALAVPTLSACQESHESPSLASQPDYGDGYHDGYDEGYKQGEDAGYEKGYLEGKAEGEQLGREQGYERGYDAGYAAGWSDRKLPIISDPALVMWMVTLIDTPLFPK